MDFKQLEAFAYVVKLKSFSRAAEQIYLTQPTISNHISTLEKELDTKLLERGSKTVYPTPSGKILYNYAEKMLNLREDAVCAVRRYNKELKGNLTICASTVPSQYVLPKLMTAFREEYPNVVFQINRQDSGQVVANTQPTRSIPNSEHASLRMLFGMILLLYRSDTILSIASRQRIFSAWDCFQSCTSS